MSTTTIIPFDAYAPRVAVVTGATHGIGYTIVHRFADDGIDVAVNDIPSKRDELRKKGGRAIAVSGDVSSEADAISIAETTVFELGSIDIVRFLESFLKSV